MNFSLWMARRTLALRDQPVFVSLYFWICLAGVALGVFALIAVLAVMEGFEEDFGRRVIGFKAPITISMQGEEPLGPLAQEIPTWDGRIRGAERFLEGEGILQTEFGGAVGVRIRGVDRVGPRHGKIQGGPDFGKSGVFLGEELALSAGLLPDFPEPVTILFPLGGVGPTGDLLPRSRTFELAGTFRSGFFEYDSKYALVALKEAASLLGEYARAGLQVWVEPVAETPEVAEIIRKRLGLGGVVRTWREQNPQLFAAMKLERAGMALLLTVFLLIAVFNIFGFLSLTSLEKVRDLAVLRSLGLRSGGVLSLFLFQAGLIGLGGALLGGGAGLGAVFLFRKFPIRLPMTYYVEFLPLSIDWPLFLLFMVAAPVVAILAALYPAWRASCPAPAEVLRYE